MLHVAGIVMQPAKISEVGQTCIHNAVRKDIRCILYAVLK